MIPISLLIFLSHFTTGCEENGVAVEISDSLVVSPCSRLYPPLDTVILGHTNFTRGNYPARIKVFQADTISSGDIVMLGNSLTEMGGNWNTKLGITTVKNRGISGDNTNGVMARLDELLCRDPSLVFLMIGTNDLFLTDSPTEIAKRIDSIGSRLATGLPDARIFVQTIMPLGAGHSQKQKAIQINGLIKAVVDPDYVVLDTYQHMADENGDLPAAFTYDDIHLTPEGYVHWVTLLKENIN